MMGLDRDKIIRVWRLALTCILVFLISWHLTIAESSWSLVTIWFVMYEYSTVGGVLNKSALRFTGTVLSALYGIIIIYCCANDPFINLIALVLGLFLYSYFFMGSDKTYTGTIGAVTLTIVLLNYNDIDLALLRVLNVVIGIVGCVLMICFFYPQYARDALVAHQVRWLNELIVWIEHYLDPKQDYQDLKKQISDLAMKITAQNTDYKKLLSEAKIETKKAPFFVPHSADIGSHCQQLFQLLHMLSKFWSKETRDNVRVRSVLQEVLAQLYQVRKKLLVQKTASNEVIALNSDPEYPLLHEALDNLLKELQKTTTLLKQDVALSTQVYEYYKEMIPDQ